MADQVIRVRIDPNEQPNDVGVQNTETPVNNQPAEARTGMRINPIMLATAINTGKQVFNFATSNIGTFTGRTDLQRRVNNGMKTARIAGQLGYAALASNPVTAVAVIAATATELAINVVETTQEIKRGNTEAEFYRQVRGNRINESRYR